MLMARFDGYIDSRDANAIIGNSWHPHIDLDFAPVFIECFRLAEVKLKEISFNSLLLLIL